MAIDLGKKGDKTNLRNCSADGGTHESSATCGALINLKKAVVRVFDSPQMGLERLANAGRISETFDFVREFLGFTFDR